MNPNPGPLRGDASDRDYAFQVIIWWRDLSRFGMQVAGLVAATPLSSPAHLLAATAATAARLGLEGEGLA